MQEQARIEATLREERARREAAELAARQASIPVVDPEIARKQKIDSLIDVGDYSTVMTFFKDQQEAIEKSRTLGAKARYFNANAVKANWTAISAEKLELKQQRALK